MSTPSDTPITAEAVQRIEKKHTHVAKNVATNYKAAFIELGFEMADLERRPALVEKERDEARRLLQAVHYAWKNGGGFALVQACEAVDKALQPQAAQGDGEAGR